ncbi:MAG: CotH kinase family protein [Lachnospiraceae bacterium]|nr:CotH kinase family protein [Lachnospiraceae bacterium]
MRKHAGLVLLCSSILLSIYLIFGLNQRISYANNVVSVETYEDIIGSDRVNDTDFSVDLFFNEQNLIATSANHCFYYSLVEGSKNANNPYIEIKSGEYNNLKVAFCEEQITDTVIKNNVKIPFVIFNDEIMCEFSLICTTLPLIHISVNEEIGDYPAEMEMYLFDNSTDGRNRVLDSGGEIKLRGATTRNYPKKSFRISLTQESVGGNERLYDRSLLGLRQDEDWILYPAYNDQEKIRNVFSQNLWKYSCSTDNRQGIETGCEYQYAELFINDEYYGLYALGYPIDEKLLGMGGTTDEEALYKKIDWFDEQFLLNTENLSESGYKIKVSDNRVSNDPWGLLLEYYTNLSENVDNAEYLYNGIDLDNAADIFLFYTLIQGLDNGKFNEYRMKNTLLALKKEKDRILGIYCPWDMDISWGNDWDISAKNYTIPYAINPDLNNIFISGYFGQLLLINDLQAWQFVVQKYQTLREGPWAQERVIELLDEYERDIFDSGAYTRDMERWPDGSYLADLADRLSLFKEYVVARLAEMDKYIERIENKCQVSIFVKNTLQYRDFSDADYFIQIQDYGLLNDSDFKDLFDYIGIDSKQITDEVVYIIGNQKDGYEYLPEFDQLLGFGEQELNSSGVEFENVYGKFHCIRFDDKEYEAPMDYTVRVDEKYYFDIYAKSPYSIRFYFKNGDSSPRTLNFHRVFNGQNK